MVRLIILIAVVAALLWLLKRLFSADPEPGQLPPSFENMRQCKYCGTHVPESSIVLFNDNPYCSQEHVDLDQQ